VSIETDISNTSSREGKGPMKIDIYTKGVLTVIAACLVYLCLGKPAFVSTAHAQGQQTHVVIDGWSYGTNNFVMQPLQDNPLPVRVVVVPQR
jgi:hypothetical protein